MIKSRSPYLCNLKLALIVLVVLGHSLEQIGGQNTLLYRFIYLFHMPLFAFVTGLHLKMAKRCLKQAKTALLLYVPIQGAIVLAGALSGNHTLSLTTPYWHLWYLLSLCWWALAAALFCICRKRFAHAGALLLPASIVCALLFGALPSGRFLSLTRTVVLFPFLLLGILCPAVFQDGPNLRTRRKLAAAGLIGIIPALSVLNGVPYAFLYHADGYAVFSLSARNGGILRGFSLLSACCLGMLVLAAVPARKLPVTKIGGDTLPAYLLHVLFMPIAAFFWPEGQNAGLVLFSFAVVFIIWKFSRWVRPLYTVMRPSERNGRKKRGKAFLGLAPAKLLFDSSERISIRSHPKH